MPGNADLHLHTNYSDGNLNPRELFKKAADAGLSAISITDHDSIDGCTEALELYKEFGIDFITGIEFSCYEDSREYHIIGYHIDITHKNLLEHLKEFKDARLKRAEKILAKLNIQSIPLTLDEILKRAGQAPIARPHIASAMLERGFITSQKEAFYLYLGEGKPAYEAKMQFSIEHAVKLINESGGVAVLAHPARTVSPEHLYKMIKKGLDGIEVIHPMHDESLVKYYRSIASQYWLLETGGSDFHGSRDYDESNFGKFVVPATIVDSIRRHSAKR